MNRTELAMKFAENFDASLIFPDFTDTMRDVVYRHHLRQGGMPFDHPLLTKAFWRGQVMDEETELGYMGFVENFLKGLEGKILEEEIKHNMENVDKAILKFTGIRNYRIDMVGKVVAVEKMNALLIPEEKRILIDHSVTNPDYMAVILTMEDGEKVFFNALCLSYGECTLGNYMGIGTMTIRANTLLHNKEEKPTVA